MPNYYAHLIFGEQVLSQLPSPLRTRIQQETAAFQIGLLGPDPLLFYRPLVHNLPRSIGVSMHRHPVRPVAERLRQAVADNLPYAESYAAGFLCHFALDSRCHQFIEEEMARSGLSHSGMEAELDRRLMLSDGIDPFHDTPLPSMQFHTAFYESITPVAYPGVMPRQFFRALASFRRWCRLQTRVAGTRLSLFASWASERYPPLAPIRGAILPREPATAYAQAVNALCALLEEEVAPTAEELKRFFSPHSGRAALSGWYDRPFSGHQKSPQPMGQAPSAPLVQIQALVIPIVPPKFPLLIK